MDHDDFAEADLRNEGVYDSLRFSQWRSRQARTDGMSRRALLRAFGGAGLALGGAGSLAGGRARAPVAARSAAGMTSRAAAGVTAGPGPIIKPLPPELFYVYESSSLGANAEMRWEVMRGKGYLVPNENFYIRDHTSTPLIDAGRWRLKVFGSGLRGAPTADNAVQFSYEDLLRMPSATVTSFIECAGNAREFFATQQGEPVTSVPWLLGGIGVAEWRGVRLADILDRAGLTPDAVDVMPQGLDPEYVTGGVNWEIPWPSPGPGSYTLRSRATDVTGLTQPDTVPVNTREYLFDAVVDHPVTVA